MAKARTAAKAKTPIETPLRMETVFPNPDQPRTEFDEASIEELWQSIESEGLLQPISVTPRPLPDGSGQGFMIVAGERRWRAHVLGGARYIHCRILYDLDDATVMVLAILENARRKDVTPLEEAVAYQKCLDRGMTVEELARRVGVQQTWRITERTCLLKLRPEYQMLLRGKQLTSSQGYEMAQLTPAGQDQLFRAIRTGEAKDYAGLRAASLAIQQSERQGSFFDLDDEPSDAEKRMAKGLESRFSQVVKVLRASTVDNEVVALKKISPDRAGSLADLARAMQGELGRIEVGLRSAGAPQLALEAAND